MPTHTASMPPAAPHPDQLGSRRSTLAGVVEVLASIIALGAIGAVFLNYVGAHLTFFGEEPVIDPEAVRYYWIGVTVLGVSVVVTLVAAALRGASRAFLWHVPVALLAVVVALLFSVTQPGPVGRGQPEQPQPSDTPAGRACHKQVPVPDHQTDPTEQLECPLPQNHS